MLLIIIGFCLYFAFEFQKHLLYAPILAPRQPCAVGGLSSLFHWQGIWAALHNCPPLPFSVKFRPKELLDSGSRNEEDKHVTKVRDWNWEEGSFPLPHAPYVYSTLSALFISVLSTPSSRLQPLSSLTGMTETITWCSSCPSGLCPSQSFFTENPIMSLSFRVSPYLPRQTPPVMVPVNPCTFPPPPSDLCSLLAFVSTLDYTFLEGVDRVFPSSFSHDPSKYPTHGKCSANVCWTNKLKLK